MSINLVIGWWLIPAILTLAAWYPTFRFQPDNHDIMPDFRLYFMALASLAASLFVWMVYFAAQWVLS